MHPHMPLTNYYEQGSWQRLAELDHSNNCQLTYTQLSQRCKIQVHLWTHTTTHAQTHMNWNGIDGIINPPLHQQLRKS